MIVLLDEFEIGLHPNWQKKAIHYMIDFLKNINDIDFNLILTSHSPFILSDLPKENVIFLDKFDDKTKEKYPDLNIDGLDNGNCINVSKHIKLNPFGANIHTLLSHGFFMKDGLMGEFAKGKIESIKKFYDEVKEFENNQYELEAYRCIYDDKEKEFWQIQNIIGEPFLQTVIKNHLEEIEKILYNEQAKTNEMKRVVAKLGRHDLKKYLESLEND